MKFDFFIQAVPGQISTGDHIAVFAEQDDMIESGRYAVARMGQDDDGSIEVMLVGLGHMAGTITSVNFPGPGDLAEDEGEEG